MWDDWRPGVGGSIERVKCEVGAGSGLSDERSQGQRRAAGVPSRRAGATIIGAPLPITGHSGVHWSRPLSAKRRDSLFEATQGQAGRAVRSSALVSLHGVAGEGNRFLKSGAKERFGATLIGHAQVQELEPPSQIARVGNR